MKALNLLCAKNHVAVIAYWTTTSFGDQFITFVSEAIDGTKTETYSIRFEGEHLFNKQELIEEYMRS